jgi:phospho-N-acetylmuramoyl-pentapeptide-transferase
MGGAMFIIGITLACLAVGLSEIRKGSLNHIFILLFSLFYGTIGFIDDYNKLKKKQNLGLRARHKFTLQLIVAIGFVLIMRITGMLTSSLYIPFFNINIPVPEPLYYVFTAFVVVGTVNSVNITDGVDGLATGVSIPVAAFLMTVAYLWGQSATGIFAAALLGGLVMFLFYNAHPAKIFMGDTGSLFLGGAICAMAFAMDMPIILLPLGIVYFIETLSDIIQIIYYKSTHGKRVFKMAPLHHHLELCGWSEYKVFAVFTAVSVVFAVISYFGVYIRYN